MPVSMIQLVTFYKSKVKDKKFILNEYNLFCLPFLAVISFFSFSS